MTYILIIFSLVTLLATFIAPGLFLSELIQKRYGIKDYYVPLIAVLFSCLLSYAIFWFYLLSPLAGEWLSTILFVLSWSILALFILNKRYRHFISRKNIIFPIILVLLVSWLYSNIAAACRQDKYADSCYVKSISIDNYMSSLYADNIRSDKPKALIGDRQGGDRPPLQSSVMLSQSVLTANPATGKHNTQLMGTILQVSWVLAVWILCRVLGLKLYDTVLVVVASAFTGFFFFNSVIVWPKLLAGSFVVLAVVLLYFENKSHKYALAGLASAAALLAHTASAFTLIPLWISVMIFKKMRPNLRQAASVIAVAAILIMPWLAYQQFYDPPSNRLGKWFFAGVMSKDDRTLPEALSSSYTSTSLGELVRNKVKMTANLVADKPTNELIGSGKFAKLRDLEFRYMVVGIGLANLGWLVLLRKKYRDKLDKQFTIKAKWLLGLTAASVVFWIGTVFLPEFVAIHTSSYAMLIILIPLLYSCILQSKVLSKFKYLLGAVIILYFFVIWVLSVYMRVPAPEYRFLPIILSAVTLFALVYFVYKTENKVSISTRAYNKIFK